MAETAKKALVMLWQHIWWNNYYDVLESRVIAIAVALGEIIGKIQYVILCLLLLASSAKSTKEVNWGVS